VERHSFYEEAAVSARGADVSHTIEADGATLTGNSDFSGTWKLHGQATVAIGDGDRTVRPMDGIRMPGHVFLALASGSSDARCSTPSNRRSTTGSGRAMTGPATPALPRGRGQDTMKVPAIEVVSSEHCPDDRAYLVAGSVSAAGALELKRRVAAGEIQALAWIEIMAREQRCRRS
jgi:hypothetical protein